MMRITPMGTRTFWMRIPFGRVHSLMAVPTGSGKAATSRTPLAISEMRLPVRVRRSSMADDRLDFLPASRSLALADLIALADFSMLSAMAWSKVFFALPSSFASAREASRERSASNRICCFKSMLEDHHIVPMNHHTCGGLYLDAANLRQAARKFDLILVPDAHEIVLFEFPLGRDYPFGQQALTFGAQGLLCAVVDHDYASGMLEKRDPAFAAGQFVGMRQEDRPDLFTGQDVVEDVCAFAVGDDERDAGAPNDLARIELGLHPSDARGAVRVTGEGFDLARDLRHRGNHAALPFQ